MDITNIPDEIKPIAILILVIVSFLPLLKFLKDIYIDFEMSKFKQIINTKGYEDGLSNEMKASLMDARDRAVFKKIYGLNLSKKYRDIALQVERKGMRESIPFTLQGREPLAGSWLSQPQLGIGAQD